MGPLIKGLLLGLIGAVVVVPLVLLLAILGVPLFAAGAAVIGTLLVVPLVILAALAFPFVLVVGLVLAAVAVAAVAAVKFAVFVALPIALIALVIGWLVRTAQARRAV